jgi:hypothetical protein
MTRRRLGTAGLLVIGLGLVSLANVAPTMVDEYLVTVMNVPVAFDLRAEDGDIDPLNPSAHPLEFVVLEGPHHGVLVGDLADVHYETPHYGVVELTYAPAEGFVGTDYVVVTVVDPFGETASGTTTIEIDVEAERAQGLLSGNWSSDITYDVQSGEFTAFRTTFTEVYRIDHLTLSAAVDWKMETQSGSKTFVFDRLRFEGDIDLDMFDIDTTLEFDPEAMATSDPVFDYWRTTTGFALLGLQFGHTLYLTKPQTESYQVITMQGAFGGIAVGNTLRIGLDADCNFYLSRDDLWAAWRYCDLRIRGALSYTCDGFEQAKLSVADIPLPLFGVPSFATLDFGLTFKLEEKSFSAAIGWQPDWIDCVKLMAELGINHVAHPAGTYDRVTSFVFYGVRIECEIPPGIRVVSATSMHPDYNSVMTGLIDYFEVIRISGDLVGCCGIPGYFGLATYFYASSTYLFDWGMTKASFDVGLSEQFTFSFDLVVHSGELTATPPWTEISVGWSLRW